VYEDERASASGSYCLVCGVCLQTAGIVGLPLMLYCDYFQTNLRSYPRGAHGCRTGSAANTTRVQLLFIKYPTLGPGIIKAFACCILDRVVYTNAIIYMREHSLVIIQVLLQLAQVFCYTGRESEYVYCIYSSYLFTTLIGTDKDMQTVHRLESHKL